VPHSATAAVGRSGTQRGILAAVFGALVAQMCLTALAPLIALFQSDLGASATDLTWLTAAIFAPTAVLELNFGVLGDMFGRRRLVIGGQAMCAVGALVAMIAGNVGTLAVGFIFMGFGAAALLPSTLATIAALSTSQADRAKAIARWAVAIALGSALSPLCGAILAQKVNLHAAFIVHVAVAIVGIVVSSLWLPDTKSPEGRTLDWGGQILCGIGLLAFVYAVIQGADQGWSSAGVISAFVIAVVGIIAFVYVELRHPSPMFQVRLLKIPAFRAAALTGLLGMLSFLGMAYSMTLKMGPINGKGPIALALPYVILQIIPLLLGPWLGKVLHHVSPRTLLVVGLVVMAAGQLWFVSLGEGQVGLGSITGPILLVGVGFIFMFSSLTAAAVNSVPHDMLGMASGATSLVRETGQTLGAAVVGAIALTHASSLIKQQVPGLGLPAKVTGQVLGINQEAGPLAVANVPFPAQVAKAVQPVAHSALERGFDVGVTVMACLSLVAAVVVAITMRGAAARPVANLEELEAEALEAVV